METFSSSNLQKANEKQIQQLQSWQAHIVVPIKPEKKNGFDRSHQPIRMQLVPGCYEPESDVSVLKAFTKEMSKDENLVLSFYLFT